MVAILSVTFAACERYDVKSSNAADAPKSVVPMLIVTDDLGRRIAIPTNVKRAISLAPSVTESIFAVGAGDRLVGDTTYCDYPEAAKAIQKIGDTLNPNMETIVALKPEVVFVSGASQLETFTNTLDQNGIAFYVMNPTSFDEVVISLNRLAEIFGTQDAAKTLSDEIEKRRIEVGDKVGTYLAEDRSEEAYAKRIDLKTVFLQISKEPLFTIGKSSFLNQVINEAGGQSVTADVTSDFPKLSKETALALHPEVIILSDSPDNQEPNDAFVNSPAVKNGRVYKINADIISRPGPRLIDALEQIARDLHPEKFPDS
jgi:iron complex transport system substrate-binding protein